MRHTVQNAFLRSIKQGLSDKNEDIRRELKPFLSDPSVTDEALLRQVNKITSEESERRQCLGRNKQTKAIYAQSGEVGLKKPGDCHSTDKDEEMESASPDTDGGIIEAVKVKVQNLQPPTCHCANASSKPSLPKRGKQHSCPACTEQNCKTVNIASHVTQRDTGQLVV